MKFASKGLREPHPFTIASSPDESTLRFMIRDLGDWTSRLCNEVRPGMRVVVEGPYGRLHPIPSQPASEVVWIAGGVGITPFFGAAISNDPTSGVVPQLFYCVRSRDDAPGLAELEAADREGRIILHVHASDDGSRLQPREVARVFGPGGLRGAHVVMCGPSSLVKSMRRVVGELGARRIHVEGFDIRAGFGPDMSRDIDALLRR